MATVTLANTGTITLSTNAQATGSASSLIGVKAALADFSTYGTLYGSTYGEGLNQEFLKFTVPSPILSEHGVISQRGEANGWGNDISDLTFTNAAGAAINVTANTTASNTVGLHQGTQRGCLDGHLCAGPCCLCVAHAAAQGGGAI